MDRIITFYSADYLSDLEDVLKKLKDDLEYYKQESIKSVNIYIDNSNRKFLNRVILRYSAKHITSFNQIKGNRYYEKESSYSRRLVSTTKHDIRLVEDAIICLKNKIDINNHHYISLSQDSPLYDLIFHYQERHCSSHVQEKNQYCSSLYYLNPQ